MRSTLQILAFIGTCFALSNTRANVTAKESTEELGVLLLGDQGKGSEGQRQVAAALQTFCQNNLCDFGILLGDNFYNSGVKNIDDPKFKTHFEDLYSPLGIEFWAVLGNHDYGFGFSRGNVQAQIDYTRHSNFWRMPTRYYSFEAKGAEFIALDTVTIHKDSQQQKWLSEKLSKPAAGLRVVLGHYPVHSSGLHGDTKFIKENIAPQMCGNTDIYAAGHDHHLEHLKTDCGVNLVLSGSGGETRPINSLHPRSVFAASKLGFAYLKKDQNSGFKVQYFDYELNPLAEIEIIKNTSSSLR